MDISRLGLHEMNLSHIDLHEMDVSHGGFHTLCKIGSGFQKPNHHGWCLQALAGFKAELRFSTELTNGVQLALISRRRLVL